MSTRKKVEITKILVKVEVVIAMMILTIILLHLLLLISRQIPLRFRMLHRRLSNSLWTLVSGMATHLSMRLLTTECVS